MKVELIDDDGNRHDVTEERGYGYTSGQGTAARK